MSKIGGSASRRVGMKLRAKVRAGANQSSQIISMCIYVMMCSIRANIVDFVHLSTTGFVSINLKRKHLFSITKQAHLIDTKQSAWFFKIKFAPQAVLLSAFPVSIGHLFVLPPALRIATAKGLLLSSSLGFRLQPSSKGVSHS